MTPLLVESRGDYEERWFCTPPPEHVGYRVIRQQWDASYTVRDIFEIQLAEAES